MNLRTIVLSVLQVTLCLYSPAQKAINADTLPVNGADTSEQKIFDKVEFEASFPGGEEGWRKYLEHNLRANVPLDNGAPAGLYTVWVQFVVDKNGRVADIKALTRNGYGTEQEVIRILQKSPQWHPATQKGRIVRAYRKQPVTFQIEAEGFEVSTQEPYLLYAGIDNPISVSANRVSSDDLRVTISEGTIVSKGEGNYIVRVTKPGRVVITLFNKKNKEIGAQSIEVRQKDQSSKPPYLIRE